jgi:hypothetical protein
VVVKLMITASQIEVGVRVKWTDHRKPHFGRGPLRKILAELLERLL